MSFEQDATRALMLIGLFVSRNWTTYTRFDWACHAIFPFNFFNRTRYVDWKYKEEQK